MNRGGKPRTGDGFRAKGKKPAEIGIMRMVTPDPLGGAPGIRRKQPKGWGVTKVIDIFTKKERR